MKVHLTIKGARKEEIPRNGTTEWYVLHPMNDSVLAYCKTEADADAVIKGLDDLAAQLEKPE